MKIGIRIADEMQHPLVDALKKLSDEHHRQARSAESYITVEGEPNETQRSTLDFAERQRRIGDALHDLATQIQEG